MGKRTISSVRIKEELRKRNISGRSLARQAGISYDDMYNIIGGKSSNLEKLSLIAKTLEVPISYLITPSDQEIGEEKEYNVELHTEVIKVINSVCRKNGIKPTLERVEEISYFVFPRLQKLGDTGKLAEMIAEAIVNYVLELKEWRTKE